MLSRTTLYDGGHALVTSLVRSAVARLESHVWGDSDQSVKLWWSPDLVPCRTGDRLILFKTPCGRVEIEAVTHGETEQFTYPTM